MPVSEPAFFIGSGDALTPREHARSPWSADHLHGRLLAGLLARAVEQEGDHPPRHCGRFTVDLFRPTPLRPVAVETRLVRDSRRLRVVDAVATCEGVASARATAVYLVAGEEPSGDVWVTPPWSAPPAKDIAPISVDERARLPWNMRSASPGGLVSAERKQVWIDDPTPLVEGEPVSPFVRVSMVADAANPLTNSGSRGLQHINADITVHLARTPQGAWLGFDVAGRVARAGLAVGQCTLHDSSGPLGFVTVTAMANGRLGRKRSRGAAGADP